jgi:hypothetical protein
MFVLERDDKDPDRRVRRRLRAAKMRIDAEPGDRWLTIKHWRGRLTLHEAAAYETKPRDAGQRDQTADHALEALHAADGPLSGAEVARRLGRDPTDGTVRRALQRLHEDGLIYRDESKQWGLPAADTATPAPDGGQTRLHTRDHDLATGLGNPLGSHDQATRCQGAHTPEGGGARGNPGNNGRGDRENDQLVEDVKAAFDAAEIEP